MNWDVENREDCLRLWQVNSNVFLYILTAQGLFMIIHPSAFHCPNNRVNFFRTSQLSVQRVNSQASRAVTSQIALSSAHWLLWFIFISIQMVSVLSWIVNAVHVSRFTAHLDPSYTRHQWEFVAFSVYRSHGLPQDWGRGICRIYILCKA